MILATARVLDSKRAKPAKENKGNEAGAHIFYLKRIVAKNAAGVLREVLADQKLTVAADERLNAIIITGKRETVKNAETVLEQLDRQAKE